METLQAHPHVVQAVRRREVLKAALVAGVTLSAWSLPVPSGLWGADAGPPKRGGILRVVGNDPPHFDHHFTLSFKTNTTLSFVHSTLVRHQLGPGIQPGTFSVEPHLAECWEQLDDTTYVFHLRKGVRWHNKPPVNGRELVAEDVKFTFDRFLTEKGNPERHLLGSVDRVEVVDRYTVKFLHHPDYFLPGQPSMDGVEWLVVEDPSTGLAMYRTGQLDCGPAAWWGVRQQDLDSLKKSHPHVIYQDMLANVVGRIYMRTDQPPFNDLRVRRAISHAIDRRGLLAATGTRGEPTPAVARGLAEWSLPIEQLGAGAKYYRHDPQEARRLLAEAGFPNGFQTQFHATRGYGPDFLDAVQLVQRNLKEVGIDAQLKLQEYEAYLATTNQGKFEGMAYGLFGPAWEPDSALYAPYTPDTLRNSSHVNDPTLTAMLQEQRQTKDREFRKQLIFDIQRYAAEQQYYVHTNVDVITSSWQPYVKNYAPNLSFDAGGAAAALRLDR